MPLPSSVRIRDLIMALSASTNSAMLAQRLNGMGFAATANWNLASHAAKLASEMGLEMKVGSVLSSDSFYDENPESWKLWAQYGVLAVEMEAAALYTLASRFGVEALCLLTVSDSIATGDETTSEEREKTFTQMMEVALETAIRA